MTEREMAAIHRMASNYVQANKEISAIEGATAEEQVEAAFINGCIVGKSKTAAEAKANVLQFKPPKGNRRETNLN